tara:strand:+ start:1978 stop:2154 length:177 start_codon:yes stop_codon:yes gene_type:complete
MNPFEKFELKSLRKNLDEAQDRFYSNSRLEPNAEKNYWRAKKELNNFVLHLRKKGKKI